MDMKYLQYTNESLHVGFRKTLNIVVLAWNNYFESLKSKLISLIKKSSYLGVSRMRKSVLAIKICSDKPFKIQKSIFPNARCKSSIFSFFASECKRTSIIFLECYYDKQIDCFFYNFRCKGAIQSLPVFLKFR